MQLESQTYWKSLINMSLSKFFILQTLYRGPTHGYALLEKLRLFTRGCCTPTYATIYPILNELADGGYASVKQESTGDRQRKVYELTEKGKSAYHEALVVWREVLPYLNNVVNTESGSKDSANLNKNKSGKSACIKT
jgi:DNA-binding PadR family transcriptional regulator